MLAQRTVKYVDVFSYDVQQEPGKRHNAPDGTPLEEPEEIELGVLVIWTPDPATGGQVEHRIRFLPENYDKLRDQINGKTSTVETATPGDLARAGLKL